VIAAPDGTIGGGRYSMYRELFAGAGWAHAAVP
jgi:hypothetical protein